MQDLSQLPYEYRYFFEAPHSPVWNDLHDPGLGHRIHSASSIPNIVGYGYDSRFVYYLRCTGLRQKEDMSENVAIQHGVENEPRARDDFIRKYPHIYFCNPGFLLHPEYPFIGATSDGFGWDSKKEMPVSIEFKCPFISGNVQSTRDIKENYLIQVTVQMACTGFQLAYLHYWFEEEESVTFEIPFCEKVWDCILKAVQDFAKEVELKREDFPKRMKKDPVLAMHLHNLVKKIKQL